MCFSRNKTCYEAVENDACHGKAASIEASSKILKLRPKLSSKIRMSAFFRRKIEGAPKVPLCTKYGAIPTIISGVTAF